MSLELLTKQIDNQQQFIKQLNAQIESLKQMFSEGNASSLQARTNSILAHQSYQEAANKNKEHESKIAELNIKITNLLSEIEDLKKPKLELIENVVNDDNVTF